MDIVGGFFSQPVIPGLFAFVCLMGFLVVAWLFYVIYRVSRRTRMQANAQVQSASQPNALDLLRSAGADNATITASPPVATRLADIGELPDLDLLLAPTPQPTPKSSGNPTKEPIFIPPTPAPTPQPIAPQPSLRTVIEDPQMVRLNTGFVVKAKEMLTILRDERDGRLMVQIGENGFRTLAESPDAKKQFAALMKELSGVIMSADDSPPTESISVDMPMPSLGDLARQPLATPSAPKSVVPPSSMLDRMEKPKPKTTTVKGGALPGDLPSYKFDDNPAEIKPGRIGFKKVDFVPPPTQTIAEAIQAYLEYKLEQTGDFEGRDIRILPAPDGSILIKVDELYFEGVNDIADTEVQAYIKQTIAEWQERQG
jgi:hypothetical protein